MKTDSDPQRNVHVWLRNHAIPLTTVEAGNGFADLQPLKRVIGNARIVALGEATHGTREFFQLKHRLLEFLVTEMGFTTFAIEANWPESQAVNDFVRFGSGDPGQVIRGLQFWTLDTHEILDLILWMRQYNARRIHGLTVTFAGFDAQMTGMAAHAIKSYLTRGDPAFSLEFAPRLTPFEDNALDYHTLSDTNKAELHDTVRELISRLLAKERDYVDRSSDDQWRRTLHYAHILRQVDEQSRTGDDGTARFLARDRAMADNITWILDEGGPEAKVVVSAHNGHVARDPRGILDGTATTMGMHLARRFGSGLVVVGFAFGEGAFQAVDIQHGRRRGVREIAVGPPPDDTLDAVFARTGLPVFMVDLRQPSEGVHVWFSQPQRTREIGAFFAGPGAMLETIVPAARYDMLAFVGKTTRARPNSH